MSAKLFARAADEPFTAHDIEVLYMGKARVEFDCVSDEAQSSRQPSRDYATAFVRTSTTPDGSWKIRFPESVLRRWFGHRLLEPASYRAPLTCGKLSATLTHMPDKNIFLAHEIHSWEPIIDEDRVMVSSCYVRDDGPPEVEIKWEPIADGIWTPFGLYYKLPGLFWYERDHRSKQYLYSSDRGMAVTENGEVRPLHTGRNAKGYSDGGISGFVASMLEDIGNEMTAKLFCKRLLQLLCPRTSKNSFYVPQEICLPVEVIKGWLLDQEHEQGVPPEYIPCGERFGPWIF